MTIGSSRARQPLSRVNLTVFTKPTSGKNRKYLCILKRKKLDNIFKNWLCPNFSSCPKNLSYPKFFFREVGGGGCSPPHPPARTPIDGCHPRWPPALQVIRAAIVSYINSSFLAKFRFPVSEYTRRCK